MDSGHGPRSRLLAVLLAPAATFLSAEASADEAAPAWAGADGMPPLLGRLHGPFAPAARASSGPHGGVLLGVDAGWAGLVGAKLDGFQQSFTFGVRGGYQFENGVAVLLRYDELGVEPWPALADSSAVQTAPRHQNLWVNQEGSGRFPSV
jgi:hypothetical protein